jgi:hypothetical protein
LLFFPRIPATSCSSRQELRPHLAFLAVDFGHFLLWPPRNPATSREACGSSASTPPPSDLVGDRLPHTAPAALNPKPQAIDPKSVRHAALPELRHSLAPCRRPATARDGRSSCCGVARASGIASLSACPTARSVSSTWTTTPRRQPRPGHAGATTPGGLCIDAIRRRLGSSVASVGRWTGI